MNVTRHHGTATTIKLYLVSAILGFMTYMIFSNNPNEDGVVWGIACGVLTLMGLYSAIRRRS